MTSNRLTRTKLAGMILLTLLPTAFFLIDTRGAFIHLRTENWPNHAMFHAITGLFYTQILCIMIVVMTWIPLRRGELWSWWCIALMGIGIHGGHVVGDYMTDHGLRGAEAAQGPGFIFFAGTVLALVLYIVALVLTFPGKSVRGK